jgi:hypothetical protein
VQFWPTSMNLQHWIDQHPAVFAAVFPIYLLCLWLLVGAIISVVGGWFSLALAPFNGAKWGMQSGRMRWLANCNNVLRPPPINFTHDLLSPPDRIGRDGAGGCRNSALHSDRCL